MILRFKIRLGGQAFADFLLLIAIFFFIEIKTRSEKILWVTKTDLAYKNILINEIIINKKIDEKIKQR